MMEYEGYTGRITALDDRQGESCCLAGSRLGDAQEITAGKNDGYGLRLDRGRGLVAFAFQRLEDCRGEAEV